MTERKRAAWLDVAASLLLALLNVILYRKVVWLWWTYDDPNNLRMVMTHRLVDPFISRAVWPQQLFTPLMLTAFSAQTAWFGLDAAKWYAMQVGLAAVMTIAVYTALRVVLVSQSGAPAGASTQNAGDGAGAPLSTHLTAFIAAAFFAAGVPMCSVVVQLSTVHYFIAITFAALATNAYVIAVRRSSVLLAVLSAVFYLAAMFAKEIAVPLPLLLLVLHPSRSRDHRRHSDAGQDRSCASNDPAYVGGINCLHWLTLVLYLVWRRVVIGAFGGAYSWVILPKEWPKLLLMLPWRVIRAMAGVNLKVGLPLLALMAIGVLLAAMQSRRALLLVIVAAIVVLGPILPVAKQVDRRYVLVPWLAWSVVFVVGAKQRKVLLIAAPLLLIVANRQEWASVFATRLRMSNEARFMVDMPPNGILGDVATPPAAMQELNWLKLERLGRPAGALWYYDDFYLCSHDMTGKRVWTYDAKTKSIVEITSRVQEVTKRYCGSIRNDVPLSVRFRFVEPALFWDLGPYEKGKYTALLADGFQAFEVPSKEALNIPGISSLPIRIRYDSPDGWTTYSPRFDLDLKHQPNFEWHR
jgi:hypothetical protein